MNPALDILLVDDNPGDADLVTEAFAESSLGTRVRVARDGVEALALLNATPLPDIVLLDLAMPRMNGHEVLEALKRSPLHRRIPVVILTSSRLPADILASYEAHASSYIVKPVGIEGLLHLVRSVEEYWVTHASLPTRVRADA